MLLLFALILVACSEDGADETSTDTETEGETTETSASPQVLVFGRGGDSTSLDPAITTEGESFKVTKNIYETLLNFGEQDTTIHPGLAEEWEVSEDGLEYTFKLQQGVKFHDGTDFNADAVIKNIDRWKAGTAEKFYYFNSMFKSEGEDIIKEVIAEDDYTVVFKLSVLKRHS